MPRATSSETRRLALLLCAVGAISVALFAAGRGVDPHTALLPDSASYLNTACAVLRHRRFSVSAEQLDVPQIERTPGYPLFLAAIFGICGERYVFVILIQILLHLGIILITYRLAHALWDAPTAWLAALLLACDLASLISAQQILTDTLFTFVLLLAIAAGVRAWRSPRHSGCWLATHSALLALATLIRPIAYYLIAPELVVVLFLWNKGRRWRWQPLLVAGLLLTLPWLALIGVWHARNYTAAGMMQFSCSQAVNLLFYRGAFVVAQRDGISFAAAQQRLGYGDYAAVHPETADWSQAQRCRHWQREGARLIRQHPRLFLRSQLWGLTKLLGDPGDHLLWQQISRHQEPTGPGGDLLRLSPREYVSKWVFEKPGRLLLFGLTEAYLLLVYVGVAIALWQIVTARNQPSARLHVWLWTLLLYFLLVSAGPEAYARFRAPIMPLLGVYAASGLWRSRPPGNAA